MTDSLCGVHHSLYLSLIELIKAIVVDAYVIFRTYYRFLHIFTQFYAKKITTLLQHFAALSISCNRLLVSSRVCNQRACKQARRLTAKLEFIISSRKFCANKILRGNKQPRLDFSVSGSFVYIR